VLIVLAAVLGLAVGSFLNVVVFRVPEGLSVVRPASACPACGTAVRARDNIPVLSWVLLRGRCRGCQGQVSLRYPLIEALTAVLFALTALRFGTSWSLPAELCFVAGLVALGAVDLERYLLPRAILYPVGVLVVAGLAVAATTTHDWSRVAQAAFCGFGSFAVFFVIHFVRPAWLGFGDVRLAALLGLGLGWMGPGYLLIGFLAANIAGAVTGIGLMLAGRATRTTALPYGVFLGAGAILALLAGAPVVSWYTHHLALAISPGVPAVSL
jgi:leader peptidase (prepilin peptidase)/N-methyltransferase